MDAGKMSLKWSVRPRVKADFSSCNFSSYNYCEMGSGACSPFRLRAAGTDRCIGGGAIIRLKLNHFCLKNARKAPYDR